VSTNGEILGTGIGLDGKPFHIRRGTACVFHVLHDPDCPGAVKVWCHKCGAFTASVFKPMPQGIAHACQRCGACRKLPHGKPYISKSEFKALRPDRAEGVIREAASL